MRLLGLVAVYPLLTIACGGGGQGPTGPAGPQGLAGPQGPAGMQGQPGTTQKLPHLIVDADNTDLGMLTGPDTAWNDQLNIEIAWTQQVQIDWDGANCTGNGIVRSPSPGHSSLRYLTPHGRLIQLGPPTPMPAPKCEEFFDNANTPTCDCTISEANLTGAKLIDENMPLTLYRSSDLSIAIR